MLSPIGYQNLGAKLKDCFSNKTYTKDWMAWEIAQGRYQVKTGKHCKNTTE